MTSIASLEAVTLPVDALRRLGERCGVQTWPVVLDLYAGTDDADAEADVAAAADALIAERGLWDGDEPVVMMATVLRTLSTPDRMIEMRVFGPDGIDRICIARCGNDHAVAVRNGDSVTLATPDIRDVGDIGALVRRTYTAVDPIRIAGFSTRASELAERLAPCRSADDFADALYGCGAAASDATALGAALTSIRSRSEIVAVGWSDGTVIQSSGALAIFDTDRGRVVVSPSESPDGQVWSTVSPGSGHRIAQAVCLLVETLPGGWWPR